MGAGAGFCVPVRVYPLSLRSAVSTQNVMSRTKMRHYLLVLIVHKERSCSFLALPKRGRPWGLTQPHVWRHIETMSAEKSTAMGLEDVLAERAPVLPVLCTQLRETAQQMDQSVQGICANFVGIARRSKDGVARTARFLGAGESGNAGNANNLAGLLEGSKRTLRALLERAAKTSEQSTLAVKRLDSVTTCSKQINTALASLNDMAIGNKLVAINARIEAARLGAQALWIQCGGG